MLIVSQENCGRRKATFRMPSKQLLAKSVTKQTKKLVTWSRLISLTHIIWDKFSPLLKRAQWNSSTYKQTLLLQFQVHCT